MNFPFASDYTWCNTSEDQNIFIYSLFFLFPLLYAPVFILLACGRKEITVFFNAYQHSFFDICENTFLLFNFVFHTCRNVYILAILNIEI